MLPWVSVLADLRLEALLHAANNLGVELPFDGVLGGRTIAELLYLVLSAIRGT